MKILLIVVSIIGVTGICLLLMCGACGMVLNEADEKAKERGRFVTVTEVGTRELGDYGSYVKYSWKATIQNADTVGHEMRLDLKWVDKDQFEIESASEYDLIVSANSERTFSGTHLIPENSAPSVTTVQGSVRVSR